MKKFTIGRNDISLTIFVPWDCKYNCKFCTSKEIYKKYQGYNLDTLVDNVISTIKRFNKTSIDNFVITGGEPFADLENLAKILEAISPTKNVFINTSLPMDPRIIDFINKHPKISSISVSRHEAVQNAERSNLLMDFALENIRKNLPIRLNCVCYHNFNNSKERRTFIKNYLDRFSCLALPEDSSINFRADYTKTKTLEDLKGFSDPFMQDLADICQYKYSNGCNVCNNDIFSYQGRKVVYHRGFEHTCQLLGNTIIVNDIIVLPDGEWYYDWDKKDENKAKFLADLTLAYISSRDWIVKDIDNYVEVSKEHVKNATKQSSKLRRALLGYGEYENKQLHQIPAGGVCGSSGCH